MLKGFLKDKVRRRLKKFLKNTLELPLIPTTLTLWAFDLAWSLGFDPILNRVRTKGNPSTLKRMKAKTKALKGNFKSPKGYISQKLKNIDAEWTNYF